MLSQVVKKSLLRDLRLPVRTFTAKATQDPLPYELNALEPVISGKLMDFHYNQHHKNYCMKFNERIDLIQDNIKKKDLKRVAALSEELRFFGGGHYNHTFFWESLAPVKDGGGHLPKMDSDLGTMIKQSYGSFENLMDYTTAEASAIMGSGWAWIAYCKVSKSILVQMTKDQNLLSDYASDLIPLLNIDVWEHAWYPDYNYAKGDYLKNIWRIINWQKAERRLASAKKM
ncbi:hypothetical protein FGO68_gene8867 [Halteria grandinella]|uniref:Superoxide dismutase n=1 Tax=Halteria grandinella TaxID=5974 RepID=A0A8J8NI48_HALGN|nr:hypothetical protein FGO68_gene8867 [Halteria grandinella]